MMLGIYIHIPFCVKKCGYCDFVSVTDTKLAEAYFSALDKEIALSAKLHPDRVDTVFLGGGTPSLPDEKYIAGLLSRLRAHYAVCEDAEVTLEGNPCTFTPEKLAAYRRHGVNRLSIGFQAAQDELLSLLGRRHTAAQFDEAYDMARAAGFETINVDVIYAIPGQTMRQWEDTLHHVLYKKPEHISAYALKIEDGTPLAGSIRRGEIAPASSDMDADMYGMAQGMLAEKGYINYEVSNFALWDRECRHNLKYWNLGNYLGLGVSAHSNIGNLRFANTDDIAAYINNLKGGGLRYASSQLIDESERKFEYIMLKMRLKQGIAYREYFDLFGEQFEKGRARQIEKAMKYGLVYMDERGVRPTAKGFALQSTLVHVLTEKEGA
ncbi:MAG TPA: coproporphyrinogen III oxidase [Clostridiales bacterium]|nr:coproporphyrinogen III oxidase [Clostridiales bacterium]